MGVSKNSGTPKSSILIGFSIINHPFWDTPIFGKTLMYQQKTASFFFLKTWLSFVFFAEPGPVMSEEVLQKEVGLSIGGH